MALTEAQGVMGKINLDVNVSISQEFGGGVIRVSEYLELPPKDFMEICKMLGQLQNLAESIRLENTKK